MGTRTDVYALRKRVHITCNGIVIYLVVLNVFLTICGNAWIRNGKKKNKSNSCVEVNTPFLLINNAFGGFRTR